MQYMQCWHVTHTCNYLKINVFVNPGLLVGRDLPGGGLPLLRPQAEDGRQGRQGGRRDGRGERLYRLRKCARKCVKEIYDWSSTYIR